MSQLRTLWTTFKLAKANAAWVVAHVCLPWLSPAACAIGLATDVMPKLATNT